MKLKVFRYRMEILPETPQDEAMLEEVFGLRHEGDSIPLTRHNASSLSCWGYADIQCKEEAE